MIVPSYHYLVGPTVAFGALLVIILICRWVFSTSGRDARRIPAPQPGGDYGLLVPVARARTSEDADLLREVLRDAGIRCTVAPDGHGAELLVFRADADRARQLVSS